MLTLTPGNFLRIIKGLMAGDGYWVERETDLGSWRAATTTVPLSASTAPLLAYAFDSVLTAIYWSASSSATTSINFKIPADFDQSQDTIRIRLTAAMAGTTDTPTITASGYRARVGDSAATAITAVASDAITGTAIAQYDILLTGNEFQPGDDLRIILTPGAHTTDILYVTGVAIGFKSCLVAHDKDGRG